MSVTDSATGVKPLFGYLSLFTSLSTLVCCALPSLLVLFGLGATVAAVVSGVPWLVVMSQHKGYVFATSGALIAANFAYLYVIAPRLRFRARAEEVCAADEASGCSAAERLSRAALGLAGFLWSVGFFVAYLLGPLLMRLDS